MNTLVKIKNTKKKPLKIKYVYSFFPFKIIIYLHINRAGCYGRIFFSCDYTCISGIRWGPKFELNWIPLHPKILCTKCGWNWERDSGEKDFKIHLYLFTILTKSQLRLKNGVALLLNSLIPSPKASLLAKYPIRLLWHTL